jgi:SAM-dependent methyltransferase
VLDVGCGCGATSRALATRVGASGSVHGVDISTPMLERAGALAREAGHANVRFTNADAQTHRFEPAGADVLFSRFGVMFFADPPAAFRNLRDALRPGGRLAFVCWRPLAENPWLLVPLGAAAQHMQLPPPPAPGAPGPFAFADPERVRGILDQAGFTRIKLDPVNDTLTVGGGGLDEAVHFLLEGVGPTSAALREADPAVRPRVFAAVKEALAPFVTREGVRMPAAAWIVTADAPAS